MTDPITTHLSLAIADLAATGRSLAADRAQRIAAPPAAAPASPASPARPPCPCELGGLWRGTPRARRRHAVLCKLHPAQHHP